MPFPLFNLPACTPWVQFLELKPIVMQFVDCCCSLALQVCHNAGCPVLLRIVLLLVLVLARMHIKNNWRFEWCVSVVFTVQWTRRITARPFFFSFSS